jgi:prepilin-type N-terminal cleavage/methylation domain-containing protein
VPRNHAFTLIELLVTLATIAVLAGLLLSGGLALREGARRGQATALVALLHQALATYRDEDPRGRFPAQPTSGSIEFAPPQFSTSAPRVGDLLERGGFSRHAGTSVTAADDSRRLQDPWHADLQYRVDATVDGTPERPADSAGQVVQVPGDVSDWNPQGLQPYAYVWSWGRDRANRTLKANIANWIYVHQSP